MSEHTMPSLETYATFLDANPDVEVLEAFVIDVNGVPRGKWLPRERALDVLANGLAMPRSALDIWGRDVDAAGLAEGTGDPDGICYPVAGIISRVPWLTRPTARVLLLMHVDKKPFYAFTRVGQDDERSRAGHRSRNAFHQSSRSCLG